MYPKEGDHEGGALRQQPSSGGASPPVMHHSAAQRQEPVVRHGIQLQHVVGNVQAVPQIAPAPADRPLV